MHEKKSPYLVAESILKQKYPDAALAFVAGSFNRNEETAFSDIDLVVIYPNLKAAWRESFVFDGWPVEAFIHDPETLNYFFYEVDAKSGIPSLPSMVAEGPAIPENHELGLKLKSVANKVLENGPSPWSEETLYHQRYLISDLIDDLRAPRNAAETNAVAGNLYEMLGNFYFRANNLWSASRKHIPRRLLQVDPALHHSWVEAFDQAFQSNTQKIIALSEQILKPFGGFLFDGYRREAPQDWRLAATSNSNKTAYKAKHISVTINNNPADVYAFASNAENLPKWAAGLSGTKIKKSGDEWICESPMGIVTVKFAEKNSFGVMDHVVTLPNGEINHNPLRVQKNGAASEVVFTLYKLPRMSDAEFDKDAAMIEKDLERLKDLLES